MSIEFLSAVFVGVTVFDFVMGWCDHVYILKDSSSSAQRKASLQKIVEAATVFIAVGFVEALKYWHQDPTFQHSAMLYVSTFVSFMTLYELRSVAAHWVSITGIRLPATIEKLLGVDQEIDSKKK